MNIKLSHILLPITLMSGLCRAEMAAVEILERYDSTRQHQKNRNIYMQTFRESTDSFLKTPIPTLRTESRFITDGKRMDFSWKRWDRFETDRIPMGMGQITINNRHHIWDEDTYYSYRDHNGTLQISDDKSRSELTYYNAYPGAVGDGFFRGDYEAFSKILRHDGIQMEAKKIDSDGSTLYSIEADTPYGHYKIYFDPKYDFSVVKAEVRKTGDDIYCGKTLNKSLPNVAVDPYGLPMSPRAELVMTLSNDEFKQVDGCWIPVNSNWEVKVTYENGRVATDKFSTKKTSIELNPDFEAIKAFIPDFPDNTKVRYIGDKSPVPLMWLNGKVVVDIDSDELSALDDAITDMKDSEIIARKAEAPEPATSHVPGTAAQVVEDANSDVAGDTGSKDELVGQSGRGKYAWGLIIILPLLGYVFYKYTRDGKRATSR